MTFLREEPNINLWTKNDNVMLDNRKKKHALCYGCVLEKCNFDILYDMFLHSTVSV